MKLTREDIKQLKYEKRFGYTMSCILLSFGIFFHFLYYQVSYHGNLFQLISADLLLILLSFLVSHFINRPFQKDLKDGERVKQIGIVQQKIALTDYEPGSGNLFIPVLGKLWPDWFGQEMKAFKKYQIVVDQVIYNLSPEKYMLIQEGDKVVLYFTKYSHTFLEIETISHLESLTVA